MVARCRSVAIRWGLRWEVGESGFRDEATGAAFSAVALANRTV